MKHLTGVICTLFAAISPAFANVEPEPDAVAYALYVAGDYDGVVRLAGELGGADNLGLAARALNAEAYLAVDRKAARRAADRALGFAEAALEIDSAKVEGHLQAAIALAMRGANMAPFRAFLLNLPSRARRHIDEALALDPDSAWALSTSAAWRLEVFRRGGGDVYGADPEEGFSEFLQARALDPGNVAIAYECALRLLASARAEWRETALDCLSAAEAGAPHSDFDRRIKERSSALVRAIAAGPKAEAEFIESQP
jgi:hypothetical protein